MSMTKQFDLSHKLIAAAIAGAILATGSIALKLYYVSLQKIKKENVYETNRSLNEYLLFHYAKPNELLCFPFGPSDSLDFPARLATEAIALIKSRGGSLERALDIGCAVGRTSFELAREFHNVLGIDYSHSFVATCRELAAGKQLPYERFEEGDISTQLMAAVPTEVDCSRVRFEQGDACALSPSILGQFDLVLAANLVDRLPEPRMFLANVRQLVRPGGMLFITTPFTWMEQFTPKSNWLGGFYDAKHAAVHSFDTMQYLLEPDFELVAVKDMPFFIREHSRKNQWSVAKASFWIRK